MNTYSGRRVWLFVLPFLVCFGTVSLANITVKTFNDANNNGIRDNDEDLISGLAVTGYDELGNSFDFLDDGAGTHTLDVVPTRLRIHVTGYDGIDRLQGVAGPTSIFFANDGASIDVPVRVNAGLDLDEMTIVIPCYEKGAASTRTDRAGIVSFPYSADGVAQQYGGTAPNPNVDATIAEVGSTWGIAYQRDRERVFASTILKRHVDLGPVGMGAVYTLDYSAGQPQLGHFDLHGYTPSVGPAIDLGSIKREIIDGVVDETTPYGLSTVEELIDRASYDVDAFDKVGKTAYGDIDITEDGKQLWLVNLHQRSLIQLDVSGQEVEVTRDALKHYLIDEIPNGPDIDFRYRRCINVGGNTNKRGAEAFTDANKVAWDRNKYDNGGKGDIDDFTVQNTMNVNEETTEAHLYQTWRRGSQFSYNIPIPKEEKYTVTLHLTEPFKHAVGDRKFDVVAEGKTVLDNFDIVAEAGGHHKAMTVQFEIEATGPTLDLDFLSEFGNKVKEAVLQGIVVEGESLTTSGVLRPWALHFHKGRGYLGLTSDGSYTQSRDHLFGYIVSFDPNNIAAGFKSELSFPLSYPRERSSNAGEPGPEALRTASWLPWINEWEQAHIPLDDDLSVQNGLLCSYPQALISDINFTEKGDIAIALMDRWAHQTGYLNYSTILGNTTFIIGYASGDLLKAFKQGDSYILEMENFDDGVFFRDDDGPSYDGEFFYFDGFNVRDVAQHGETITGGSGVLKGTKEVVITVHNPSPTELEHFQYSGVFTQGIDFYSTEDGSITHSYLFVDQYIQGKANGLGDVEFAIAPPLVEVGNYVWCDANANGIQDPIEFGLPGIELSLRDKENALAELQTTTTGSDGEYVFTGLAPDHCYEIWIDIDQLTALGFSGMTGPLQQGMDSLIDSDADPNMRPGLAVAMFCTDADGNNRHDIDFGFGGPSALDAIKFACEGAGGCTTFDLSTVDICVDTSGSNTVRYYPTFNDADSMIMANEISGTIDVCMGDTMLYARVMRPTDPMCYSIARVTLQEINLAPTPPAFNVVICPSPTPPTFFDVLTYLQNQGFRGDASTELFSDFAMMMPIANPVAISSFPTTIYFDDTVGIPGCGISGSIVFDSLPAATVDAGSDAEICGLECVDLTTLGATFDANGSGSTMAAWSTSGSGTFVDDNSFLGARLYCPDSADMLAGEVILRLAVTDDACGRTIMDSMRVMIMSSEPMFLPDPVLDTIDCTHPFVSEQLNNDTFPKCQLVVNCGDTINARVIDYDFDKFPCTEDIVKRIIRTQRVIYGKQEYFCTDTIYVRGLNFDEFMCPPERDTVYCHSGYKVDEYGHPHPDETGVPTAGGIPLWPQPDKACEILVIYKDYPFDGSLCPELIRREWHIKNNCSGRYDTCYQWLMIADTLGPYLEKDLGKLVVADSGTFVGIEKPVIFVPTSSHDCEAHTYIPSVMAEDTCSDVKMVKARIENIGSAVLTYNPDTDRWETHEVFKIPRTDAPIPVIYEALDFCHNITRDTCYFFVKDFTKPVTVCDKGINVTMSDTMVWLPAEVFDEGSWDNCGISLLLARRSDWATACGVNLCDTFQTYCYTEHHDSLYCPVLEVDKHLNPVEAHYAKTLQWLCEDDQDCSDLIIGGWWYDLIKQTTLECIDHPYPVDQKYFEQILKDPTLTCYYDMSVGDICEKMGFNFNSNLPEFAAPFFGESDFTEIDVMKQIGGGWSKEVPFCCEDACQNVMVEVLAMDYWCNWSKCWTYVYVEDKTPPKVVCDLFDVNITCTSYKQFYEDAVNQALAGDFTDLDSLLGGYDKVAYDEYDNLPEKEEYIYYNVLCDSVLVEKDSLLYDEHEGYIWKTYSHYEAVYDTMEVKRFHGQVADDCGLICVQEIPWIKIDECGNGYIKRTFKFIGQCIVDETGHKIDTITRYQTIWINSDCDIQKSMFKIPEDQLLVDCGIVYDEDGSGNAAGMAHPDRTGWPEYIFDDDCKQIGIGYYDKVFKIVGGDEGCYKIIRTWCFGDWCVLDGTPSDYGWWFDEYYEGKLIKCVQKIVLIDTTPPVCTINIPDTIEANGCYYNLKGEVEADDLCGLLEFSWELRDDKTDELIAFEVGQLNTEVSDVIQVDANDLEPGIYNIKVVLKDDCQNESICKKVFEILAKKKPAPVCISSLTLELTPMDGDGDGVIDTAMGTVWASEFNVSSSAACGSDSLALEFRLDRAEGDAILPPDSADQLTFGCADLGPQVVRMYVIDESGTWDYCEVILIVQDNGGGCNAVGTGSGVINGIIANEFQKIVQNVDVSLESETGVKIDVRQGVIGTYDFKMATGNKGYVIPYKNTNHINGVSTRDMINIQRHILGLDMLDSWYQEKAADVNADGRVSAGDIIQMRKLILGMTDVFPDNTSWRFFNKVDNKEQYHINPMLERMRIDFVAVKTGDTNGDHDPALAAPRSNQTLRLQTRDQIITAGTSIRMPISVHSMQGIEGYQFTLLSDPKVIHLEGVEIHSNSDLRLEDFNQSALDQGWITTAWFNRTDKTVGEEDMQLFSVRVTAQQDLRLSDVITIGSKITTAEAYNDEGMTLDVSLEFLKNPGGNLKLYQNRPNPFKSETIIGFEVPEQTHARLTIFDVAGRQVDLIEGQVAKGYHEWKVKNFDLPASGVLYYKLETDSQSEVKKMILMDH